MARVTAPTDGASCLVLRGGRVSLRRALRSASGRPDAWTSAVDRYRRAVERYHSSPPTLLDRALRRELIRLGEPLDAVLTDVEEAANRRHRYDSARAAAVLGCIHRAATLCAHATEAALMAGEAARRRDTEDVARCLDTVRLLVKRIDELGDEVRR